MRLKYILAGLFSICCMLAQARDHLLREYNADNTNLHYTGRIDFSNPKLPRFWNPGVYIQARFIGTSVNIKLNDEIEYNKNHNYIEIAVDKRTPYRVQTTGKSNLFKVDGLGAGVHTITICKDTESGYLEMVSLQCEKLLPWIKAAKYNIEYIGDSITCGTGSDLSATPCDKGEWFDQHNAYMSYGPTSARALAANWQLTAISGVGLVHSCCQMKMVMPEAFDKLDIRALKGQWDFKSYIPDVVTVCLGQNDGKQDSSIFCLAYIKFILTIKSKYPQTTVVMLTSPMGDEGLTYTLKKYILGVEASFPNAAMVHHYFFNKQYHNGCGGHPDMAEHQLIAAELSAYIKQLKHW